MTTELTAAGRLRRAIARRIGARADEAGFAILSAIVFMIIMAGIGTVILTVVLAQVVPSYIAQKNTKTVYAAQAGMQASLGILRSVSKTDVTGKVFGDPSKLPCAVSGGLNPSSSDGLGYSVTIQYYSTDPTGQSDGWLSSNQLPCAAGAGVTTSSSSPLKFALLESHGTGPALPGTTDTSAANRSIAAVYAFNYTTENVPGGRVYDYNDSNKYCMSAVPPAGFTTAQIGSKIQFLSGAACAASATNDPLQLWVYDTDYEIKLASTLVGAPLVPLCITGPVGTTDPQNATLQQCASGTTRWNQLWSWQGSNTWEGMNSGITDLSGWYLSTGKAAQAVLNPTDYLKVTKTTGGGFSPSTAVGAAAAGVAKDEIVNFKEFGRCTDATNEQWNYVFMITYPCKQDPTGGVNLDWNQKWYYTEPTAPAPSKTGEQIYVYASNTVQNASTKYCLTRPASITAHAYVTFQTCGGSYTAAQTWTRVYDSGTYTTSYLFTSPDSTLCLAADATPSQLYAGWSTVTVATCDGSDAQKWNAPVTSSGSVVGGYKEIP